MADSTAPRCPLSGGAAIVVDEVRTADLIKLFRRIYAVDIVSDVSGASVIRLCHCLECDLRFFDPPTPGSERFYEQFQRHEWYYKTAKDEYGFAARFIRPDDAVLDVGCGVGVFASISPAARYLGLELSRAAKEKAGLNGIRVENELVQDHARTHAGDYDVVVAFQLLEHVPDPKSFLEACAACLRPGGTLVVSTPAIDSYCSLIPSCTLDLPPHHMTRWSDRCLESLGRYLPLDWVETRHELMSPDQTAYFIHEMFRYGLMRWLGITPRLADARFRFRIFGLMARIMTRLGGAGFSQPRIGAWGAHVAAAFHRRS